MTAAQSGPSIPFGHLPVGVHLPEMRFDLLDLSDESFAEPFTSFTIEGHVDRLRQRGASILQCGTGPISTTAATTSASPLGFVFHTGRCGSSLLCNILNHDPELVVLREVQAVNDLSALLMGASPDGSATATAQILRDVLTVYARDVCTPPRRLIYKWTSWSTPLLPDVHALFPHAKSVFVYRDPVDVVRSFLSGVPHWADVLYSPRTVQAMSHPAVLLVDPGRPMTAARFYTAAWLSQARAALLLPPDRVLCIDYRDLVRRPDDTIARVAAHLGTDVVDNDAIAAEMGQYSKRRAPDDPYDPSSEDRKVDLRAATRREIRRATDDAYQALTDHASV